MTNLAARVRCADEAAVAQFAGTFASRLAGGETVWLSGGLGAGKTTFVRYLAAALGSDDAVSSPTFTLNHRYSAPHGMQIDHWDLYRLTQAPLELLEPVPRETIRIIEWPERCSDLESPTYAITITADAASQAREFEIC